LAIGYTVSNIYVTQKLKKFNKYFKLEFVYITIGNNSPYYIRNNRKLDCLKRTCKFYEDWLIFEIFINL